jgi:hypothetical protein
MSFSARAKRRISSRLRKNGEFEASSPPYFCRIDKEGAPYRIGAR